MSGSTAILAFRRIGSEQLPARRHGARDSFLESVMNKKMNLMGSGLLIGSVITVLAVAQPALAQDATATPATKPAATSINASTNLGVSAVDAGRRGRHRCQRQDCRRDRQRHCRYEGQGDVGGAGCQRWLESKKLIAVQWKNLKADADGKIHTSLTKESAQACRQSYAYSARCESRQGIERIRPGLCGGRHAGTDHGQHDREQWHGRYDTQNADGSFNASKVVGLAGGQPCQ